MFPYPLPNKLAIYCVDRLGPAASLLHFTGAVKLRITDVLNGFFRRVCLGTQLDPYVSWSRRTRPLDYELAVHFVNDRPNSIVTANGGAVTLPPLLGSTFWARDRMIAEVYVAPVAAMPIGALRGDLLARLAFHELMHDKIDAHPDPQLQVVPDMHVEPGVVLGLPAIPAPTAMPSPRDLELLRLGLMHLIPQYW